MMINNNFSHALLCKSTNAFYKDKCGVVISGLLLLVLLTIASTLQAQDNVYQYQDNRGNLVVSNIPNNNATTLPLPQLSVYAKPMSAEDVSASGYTPKLTPGFLPSTNSCNANNINNSKRQQILCEELNSEEARLLESTELLAQTKQIGHLNTTKSKDDFTKRISLLEDSITEHNKNIALLKQQLSD